MPRLRQERRCGLLDLRNKVERRIAAIGLLGCIGVAIFGLTVAAQAATYVAIDESDVIGKSGGSGS